MLAASLPDLEYDCGLGTAALFTRDVADRVPVDGAVTVGRVTPDAAALDDLAAAADRRAWWLDRLSRCHVLLDH
ncbi:hypothetical protein ACWGJP_02220 [Microbacterium sp. NPDC055903]